LSELKLLHRPVIEKEDHINGSVKSPIVLLHYGDYQCRNSKYIYTLIKKLQRRLKENFCFVFRNYPKIETHPRASWAALAAEAAFAQNKFWEMYDILFSNQDKLEDEDILNYAEKIKLDMDLFKRDYFNKVYLGKIRKDLESAGESGVVDVPTIFINGVMYEESYDEKTLLNIISRVASVR
jgi:protein-disulfide isomerase